MGPKGMLAPLPNYLGGGGGGGGWPPCPPPSSYAYDNGPPALLHLLTPMTMICYTIYHWLEVSREVDIS